MIRSLLSSLVMLASSRMASSSVAPIAITRRLHPIHGGVLAWRKMCGSMSVKP
eukprot:CAMPEP_0202042530 /NCGR_PEP_ID=MMETSP0962-20130828/27562_1 /ASSEMBLY_ACC=CAM_ASM_000488 /TAXON_ID=4773 /ORGANISM="Schizochytrium aggregatum, Strain ATCC28209" /LENGTH=52 /DNA_ID=CAMNT_0048606937 /DNA_START=397 /DNA_END=551 /DNA_ORIENTATION=+